MELLLRRYGADASPDERAALLADQLLVHAGAHDWKSALKREICKPEYALEALTSARVSADGKTPLRRLVDKLGLTSAIKRAVVDRHCENARQLQAVAKRQTHDEEATLLPEHARGGSTLDVVAAARENWEHVTREELLRFASESAKSLLAPVWSSTFGGNDQQDGEVGSRDDEAVSALPATNPAPTRSYKPPPSTRFLYDGHDLLHVLQSIKPANRSALSDAAAAPAWGSIQLQLHAPSTHELRRFFTELSPGNGQIGVDELFPLERQAFLAEKNRVGDLVCARQSVAMARQYAKTGCPTSLRAAVWRRALGLAAVSAEQRRHFSRLQRHIHSWTYVTDDMFFLDLQRAIDSSDYFVFQDLLDSVIMAFTRDGDVLDRAVQVSAAVQLPQSIERRLVSGADGDQNEPDDDAFNRPMNAFVPPNGVLPFSGLVLYAAPLTYMYADEVELYAVFREMYVRYWSRLNAVRSEKSTILPLSKLFEELVQRSSPAAVFHLLSVGLTPLDIAFPWIQSAFSGVLEIHQLLLLWDRIVGYDSLELLAVLAAALFHWRAAELEHVATMDGVGALYAELLEIRVVPLLQEYLFLMM